MNKKIVFLMAVCFVWAAGICIAQTQPPTNVQVEAVQSIANDISKYAGIGAEVGSALKGAVQALDQGLTVTEDHVYKFTGTTAGKFTMAIIVWKIAGEQLVGVIVGFILLIILVFWIKFWMQRFFTGKMILMEHTGKDKKYGRTKLLGDVTTTESYAFWCFVFVIGSLFFFFGAMACFFGGNY